MPAFWINPWGSGGGGSGTVTSVALSMPAIISVSGSPVTTTGTLTGTLATQVANRVWAGPTTGVDAAPTFRALVADDIPSLDAAKITTGVLAIGRLATGTPDGTKFVRDDGTLAVPAGGSPGGSTTQVQFNNAGVFDGNANFVWNNTDSLLSVISTTSVPNYTLAVSKSGNVGTGALSASSNSTTSTQATVSINNSGTGFGMIVANASSTIPAIRVLANANRTSSGLVELGCSSGVAGTHQDALYMYSSVSGAGTAGTSIGIKFDLESSTTVQQDAGRIAVAWSTATHASRTSYIAFQTVNNAGSLTERFRIEGPGSQIQTASTANTSAVVTVNTVKLNSTGTAAANFGARTLWQLESSTTDSQDAVAIDAYWSTATHASRTSRIDFNLVYNASSLSRVFRIYDDGIDITSINTGVAKILLEGNMVLRTRASGWSAMTGTAKTTSFATYSGTAEVSYTQATIQTLMDAVRDLSERLKAYDDLILNHHALAGA